jgi:serine/threonine-protein kinase
MATCPRCSRELDGDSRFCPGCGTPVRAAAGLTMTAAAGAARTTSQPSDSSALGHGRFEPGTKLGTRWRIVGLLGRGGMGEVYRADDLELGQSVALKFLPERVAKSPTELARFRNEVRVARQIAHPNVARTYDIGEADGHVFLSMEYIDGEDLASVLRRMGRPSTDKALEISRQLCLGLAAAHDSGVLHRDLKPANVMIDGRGRVRITDFGLAGLAEELEGDRGFAGTPAYMAPEQLAGQPVSRRSDVYSLGLILYEIFTGKRVFETSNVAELKQLHASGSVTTPASLARDVDPAVERLVLACLERDPQQRPPSAYAVLGALPGADPLAAALAAGETPSPELVANAGQTGGLRPRVAVTMAVAILAIVALGIGFGGTDLEVFDESPQVLSLRAAEVLEVAGIDEPPPYSAMGFDLRQDLLKLRDESGAPPTSDEMAASGAVYSGGAGARARWSRPISTTRRSGSTIRRSSHRAARS